MVLGLPARLPRDRMGFVEANQPLAVRPVQRQRIVQSVRLLRRYLSHNEAHPVAALRIDDQPLPIEVEQHIKGGVARRRYFRRLSD